MDDKGVFKPIMLIGDKYHEAVIVDPLDPDKERYKATAYVRMEIVQEIALALMHVSESADDESQAYANRVYNSFMETVKNNKLSID